jgi:hypothetical protein
MRTRRECLDCTSHTFMDECVNCGSTRLRVIEKTLGDVLLAGVPMSAGARRWQRDMLGMPGSAASRSVQQSPQV